MAQFFKTFWQNSLFSLKNYIMYIVSCHFFLLAEGTQTVSTICPRVARFRSNSSKWAHRTSRMRR